MARLPWCAVLVVALSLAAAVQDERQVEHIWDNGPSDLRQQAPPPQHKPQQAELGMSLHKPQGGLKESAGTGCKTAAPGTKGCPKIDGSSGSHHLAKFGSRIDQAIKGSEDKAKAAVTTKLEELQAALKEAEAASGSSPSHADVKRKVALAQAKQRVDDQIQQAGGKGDTKSERLAETSAAHTEDEITADARAAAESDPSRLMHESAFSATAEMEAEIDAAGARAQRALDNDGAQVEHIAKADQGVDKKHAFFAETDEDRREK